MHDADTLFWDLDGTLTDPYEGITRSVAYALHFFDIEVPDRTVLCPFIGPPLKDSFMRFYGFSSADAELAIARYRDYFAGKGLFENTVYPGIPSLLDALENAGRRMSWPPPSRASSPSASLPISGCGAIFRPWRAAIWMENG